MLFARRLQLLLVLALGIALLVPVASASAHRRRHHHHRRVHTTTATTSTCAYADTPASSATRDEMRAAVDCLVNYERTSRGLPQLDANSKLDRAAQLWTNVIVSTGVFSHGSNFAARFTAVGFIWGSAGENIATGFQTPRQVVTGWMGSPDHCRNILDPHYLDVGTGVSTQTFGAYGPGTWTQDFGLPLGHRPPSGNTGPQSGCPY